MTPEDRRFALRKIPYGVHVVTALDAHGGIAAQTAHWVTQTSFNPPLIAVAVPSDGLLYAAIRATQRFAVHMLGRDDAGEAIALRDGTPIMEDGLLTGWGISRARSGLPLLNNAVAVVECAVLAILEFGDHHLVARKSQRRTCGCRSRSGQIRWCCIFGNWGSGFSMEGRKEDLLF